MDYAAQRAAHRAQTGQIEGPIFAEQKGNKLTLRSRAPGGRKIGRCRLAVIRTTTLRLPVLADPPPPSLRPPSPTPAYFQPSTAATPFTTSRPDAPSPLPPSLLPCCALSVPPFPAKSATTSSWLLLVLASPYASLPPPPPPPSFDSHSPPPYTRHPATPVLLNGENYQMRFPSGSKHQHPPRDPIA